jgi:ribosomal protein S27E
MGRGKREPVQIKCPRCQLTKIIYIPDQDVPNCPECDIPMVIAELLDEGKSF